MTPNRPIRGFTLIEVVVVTAIIVLLIGLVFFSGAAVRERGRQATCMNNLRQIGVALAMYAADYQGPTRVDSLPLSARRLYPNYVTNRDVFICPDDYERSAYGVSQIGERIAQSYIYPVIRGSLVPDPDLHYWLKWNVYQRRGEKMPVGVCRWHARPDQVDAWEQPPVTWIVLRIDGSVERVRKPGSTLYCDL